MSLGSRRLAAHSTPQVATAGAARRVTDSASSRICLGFPPPAVSRAQFGVGAANRRRTGARARQRCESTIEGRRRAGTRLARIGRADHGASAAPRRGHDPACRVRRLPQRSIGDQRYDRLSLAARVGARGSRNRDRPRRGREPLRDRRSRRQLIRKHLRPLPLLSNGSTAAVRAVLASALHLARRQRAHIRRGRIAAQRLLRLRRHGRVCDLTRRQPREDRPANAARSGRVDRLRRHDRLRRRGQHRSRRSGLGCGRVRLRRSRPQCDPRLRDCGRSNDRCGRHERAQARIGRALRAPRTRST